MSLDLLGDGFDLHGGGMDLAFPHHENERAQAVGLDRAFARHWVHNGWVMVGGEKMSKSLGNFTSLTDLLERADARAYRLLVLRAHYRSPIEVTLSTVEQAEQALARLDDLARRFELSVPPHVTRATPPELVPTPTRWRRSWRAWTTTSTPPAPWPASSTWRVAPTRPLTPATPTRDGPWRAPPAVLCAALGLTLGGPEPELDGDAAALVAERDATRAAGDYDRADAIRAELEDRGWVVEDGPEGTRLHRRSGP